MTDSSILNNLEVLKQKIKDIRSQQENKMQTFYKHYYESMQKVPGFGNSVAHAKRYLESANSDAKKNNIGICAKSKTNLKKKVVFSTNKMLNNWKTDVYEAEVRKFGLESFKMSNSLNSCKKWNYSQFNNSAAMFKLELINSDPVALEKVPEKQKPQKRVRSMKSAENKKETQHKMIRTS